jgi:hypothetical protein
MFISATINSHSLRSSSRLILRTADDNELDWTGATKLSCATSTWSNGRAIAYACIERLLWTVSLDAPDMSRSFTGRMSVSALCGVATCRQM